MQRAAERDASVEARGDRPHQRPGDEGMNRSFAAALAALMTNTAVAADFGPNVAASRAPAPVVSYNWSGAYAGLNLGYLWSSVDLLGVRPRGIAGGAQAGYSWQVGQFVLGGEADLQVSAADDTFAAYKFSNPWFGTARGRLGYAFDNVLAYATAGLARGAGRLEIAGLTESRSHTGWTAGGGVEIGLAPAWSAKAEYLFIALSDKTYVLSGTTSGADPHIFRLGVNYRF